MRVGNVFTHIADASLIEKKTDTLKGVGLILIDSHRQRLIIGFDR